MPIQHFTATVSQVRDLTHDVREINLRLLDPPAIVFKAGQFISFEVLNPHIQRPVVRPYSIASPPSRPDIDLVLNLVAGGPGSTYLFGLKEGDETRFNGPAGSFYLREDDSRAHLFVATGTGIAPLRSMLYAFLERGNSRPVSLYWGLRNERDLYYQDELGRLANAHSNFSFITTLSRPESGWAGERGRVTRLVEERITSVQDLAVYLCGNGGMITEVTEILRKKGLCPVYREKYYD
jgi:NAD(P)H-flavin reductase